MPVTTQIAPAPVVRENEQDVGSSLRGNVRDEEGPDNEEDAAYVGHQNMDSKRMAIELVS